MDVYVGKLFGLEDKLVCNLENGNRPGQRYHPGHGRTSNPEKGASLSTS